MNLANSAQLNRLNSRFVIEKTMKNHMSEARLIVFNRLKTFTDKDVEEEARRLASERLDQNLKRYDEITKKEENSLEFGWKD
jgi:hypothetical protein